MSRTNRGSHSKRAVLCMLVCVSGTVGTTLADGYRNPPEGAAVLGRGGVHLTEVNDLTAATHNPANLADLKVSSAMASATIGYAKTDYTAPSGATASSKNPWVVLPAVFAATPLSDGYVLGVGLTTPFGQSKEWEKDSVLRFSAPYFAQLMTADVSPIVAKRVSERVTVGAGLDLMWSQLEFKQLLPLLPPPAGLSGPTTTLKFKGDGYGVGAHAGLTWDATDKQRAAITYRSPIQIDHEGDFNVDPYPAGAFPPPVTSSSDFAMDVDFPQVVAIGYGVAVSKTVRLEANVEWVEHSRNKSLDLDIANNNALLLATSGSTSIPQDWDDTWTFALGGDWQATPSCVLRAGWTYLPTPIPDETLAATLAESDKHVLGIGAGYAKGDQRIDVAYVYNIQDDRDIDTPANPVNGTYEVDQHLLSIAYGRNF